MPLRGSCDASASPKSGNVKRSESKESVIQDIADSTHFVLRHMLQKYVKEDVLSQHPIPTEGDLASMMKSAQQKQDAETTPSHNFQMELVF